MELHETFATPDDSFLSLPEYNPTQISSQNYNQNTFGGCHSKIYSQGPNFFDDNQLRKQNNSTEN